MRKPVTISSDDKSVGRPEYGSIAGSDQSVLLASRKPSSDNGDAIAPGSKPKTESEGKRTGVLAPATTRNGHTGNIAQNGGSFALGPGTDKSGSMGLGSNIRCAADGDRKDMGPFDSPEQRQLVDRAEGRQLTNTEAIIHLFKIFTGPSTVGMPKVMMYGGLWFGLVGFLVIGYLANYGNVLVVNCGRLLCRRTGVSALRYEELMELTVLSYSDSERGRRLATAVRRLTVAMLCMCLFGILAFYIQVIGTIVQYELVSLGTPYRLPIMVTYLFISLLLIPYSWIKNLKILSWFSLVANLSIMVCVVAIFMYAGDHLQPVEAIPWVTRDLWTVPLFLSAAVFSVEGVPMLLPIENRVKEPAAFGGLCGIITLAGTGNIIINVSSGFYGYLAYGDAAPDNVLTALPDHWFYHTVSLLYALMVFLTYTLQLFLIAEFVNEALQPKIDRDWFKHYGEYVIRTVIVIASYLMAIFVANMQLIMSLTGAFCSVPLLFFLPSLGELILLRKEPGGVPKLIYFRNVSMIVIGVVVFLSGTFVSVVTIFNKL